MDDEGVRHRSFEELFERVRQGDEDAAWDLVEMYGPHVMRAVRRTLSRELRAKFDSDDFAQAVWASFFAAVGEISDVNEPGQLVGLLSAMARNKVVDEIRRRVDTQKYSVRREEPLWKPDATEEGFASREPRPSQVAIARERWTRMIESQPEHYRAVMRLRLMGKTQRSIAAHLGLSEKTVQRVMEQLQRVD